MKDEHPFVSEAELKKLGYTYQNEMIKKIDINIIGHFGNVVTVEILATSGFVLHGYGMTRSVGLFLQALYALLDLEEEDGRLLSSVRNIPCRIVTDGTKRIGIGNYIADKFLLECDVANIAKKL